MTVVASVTEFEGQGHSPSQNLMVPAMPPNRAFHLRPAAATNDSYFILQLQPATKLLRVRCHEGVLLMLSQRQIEAVSTGGNLLASLENDDLDDFGWAEYGATGVTNTMPNHHILADPVVGAVTATGNLFRDYGVLLVGPEEHIYAVQDREYGGHGIPQPDGAAHRESYYFRWLRENN